MIGIVLVLVGVMFCLAGSLIAEQIQANRRDMSSNN